MTSPTPLRSADLDDTAGVPHVEPEAPARRQPGERFEVFIANPADPDGFDLHELTVLNPDRIAYETTAARHKEWPPLETGQNFALSFVLFAAAKRTGVYDGPFDAWQRSLMDWNRLTGQDVPADPTR